MNCEIEFLAVGEGSRAGDAIVIRYGQETDFKLMVVDGGTAETGEKLVRHLRAQFGENVVLEHVVLTHSDADHASGLREVLREIPVRNLWMHVPWQFAAEALHLFADKTLTIEKLAKKIKNECDIIAEIVEIAEDRDIPVRSPFEGEQIGPFVVMSPNRYAYVHLLPQFSRTPDPDKDALEAAQMWIGKAPKSVFAKIFEAAKNWTTENWSTEKLRDDGVTSASNESSAILYASTGKEIALLTGDAGINALTWAADYADRKGLALQRFTFVQIPHHGSRRNVGPTILNRIVGKPIPSGGATTFAAFVSCPAKDDTHPRKIVLNAFIRRGGRVHATEGTNKVHWGGFSPRVGYEPATSIEFSPTVEEYD